MGTYIRVYIYIYIYVCCVCIYTYIYVYIVECEQQSEVTQAKWPSSNRVTRENDFSSSGCGRIWRRNCLSWAITIWFILVQSPVPHTAEASLKKDGLTFFTVIVWVNSRPWGNLVGGWATPLKSMSSSIGMMKFPIYGKKKWQPNHQPDWNNPPFVA